MEFLKSSFNIDNMQKILDYFTELTGIRVAYFHEAKEKVTGNRKEICRFCSEIRKSSGILKGCLSCDKAAFLEAEKHKSLYLYTCHIGLWEAVVPLFIRNKFTGCLMIGQVRSDEDADNHWEHIKDKLLKSGLSAAGLETIKTAFIEVQSFSRQKIEAAAKMLEMITHYIVASEIIQIYDIKTVDKTRRYIETNFKENLSIGKIAGTIGLSASYLSYLFHKETGFTITEYLGKLKMDFAKGQLLVTSLSIKEIAAEAGYEDPNYFSRVFSKYTGCSPAKYRYENKN